MIFAMLIGWGIIVGLLVELALSYQRGPAGRPDTMFVVLAIIFSLFGLFIGTKATGEDLARQHNEYPYAAGFCATVFLMAIGYVVVFLACEWVTRPKKT